MSNRKLSCMYLEAGAKSSPVIIDPTLHTGNEQTLYLFHQMRNQIIEYRRDIVEAKLRELNPDEQRDSDGLQKAYEAVRTEFTPRGGDGIAIPEKAPPPKVKASPPPSEEEEEEIDLIDDDELLVGVDDD